MENIPPEHPYITILRARKLAPKTITAYAYILKELTTIKPIHEFTQEDLTYYFNSLDVADSTRNLRTIQCKKIFKDIGKPEITKWMTRIPVQETLKADDILTPGDINQMIATTDNPFVHAVVAFIYETGCRISEALALRHIDFIETNLGMTVTLKTTKTGAGFRKLILPFSAQYIRNLKIYSGAKTMDKVFKLSYSQTVRYIKQTGAEAGITKPVRAHMLRHAQATEMVHRKYNESIIRKKLGWSPSSKMIQRYIHLNDNDVIEATLEESGITNPENKSSAKENIRKADALNIVDASGQLAQLMIENIEMKSYIESLSQELRDTRAEMLHSIMELKNLKIEDIPDDLKIRQFQIGATYYKDKKKG